MILKFWFGLCHQMFATNSKKTLKKQVKIKLVNIFAPDNLI